MSKENVHPNLSVRQTNKFVSADQANKDSINLLNSASQLFSTGESSICCKGNDELLDFNTKADKVLEKEIKPSFTLGKQSNRKLENDRFVP